MQQENCPARIRVLFNSVPHAGHYISLSRIAEKLSQVPEIEVAFSISEYEVEKLDLLKGKVKFFGLKNKGETPTDLTEIPIRFFRVWEDQLEKIIDDYQPAVVVCDLFSESLMKVAKRRNITTVIHVPLPITILSVMDIPTLNKSVSLFGVTSVIGNNLLKLIVPKGIRSLFDLGTYFDRSLVLVSSFFGIEEAQSLPPNIKLIGTTIKQEPKKIQLETDFQDWLESVKGKDIVYVTFGSLAKFTDRFVHFLYEGLKKLDIAVIWSLREGTLPEKNPHFFVRKWLPQVEIMKMDQVKLVITHSGWGGVSECIQGLKPMLCVPVFGDQPHNADLVEKREIGLILRKQKQVVLGLRTIDEPLFTHSQLEAKVNRLRTDVCFRVNLKRLYRLMMEAGGVDEAVRLIKNAAENGVEHLVDKQVDVIRRRSIIPFLLVATSLIVVAGLFVKKSMGSSNEL